MAVVSLTVNGNPVSQETEDRTLRLVYFLRDQLGLTRHAYRLRYQPVRRLRRACKRWARG